jgi:hypothetical protein
MSKIREFIMNEPFFNSHEHQSEWAFGGDTWSPFGTVGYAKQARIGIANCLNRKIQRGKYSQSTAEMVWKCFQALNNKNKRS